MVVEPSLVTDDLHRPGMRLPDFLIVGAPRCGTTALADYLREHPDVFVSVPKELNFFNRVAPKPAAVEHYASSFAGAGPDTVAGEASPVYLESSAAPERMASVVPRARLIACLRDPVDRAYSHYWWRRLWRAEERPFTDAVADELAGNVRPGAQYLGYGLYFEQIQRLLRFYPRESLLTVLFSDIVQRPGETYARVCGHIGARDDVQPEIVGRQINTTMDVRSPRLWRMTQRWRERDETRYRLVRLIDSWNLLEFDRPPMDQHVRHEVAAYFKAPNARLAEWLDRDLSHWTGSDSPRASA